MFCNWHDYLEIGLCVEGAGTFKFSSMTYPIALGDVFIINNYEQHVASFITEYKRPHFHFHHFPC